MTVFYDGHSTRRGVVMRFLPAAAFFGAMLISLTSGGAPAHACIRNVPIVLADVKYAHAVVVGYISDYTLVGWGGLGGHARFKVSVDEVLIGNVPDELVVTWDNSTFGEPDNMPPGPFLIALRDPRSGTLPLRGSAAIFANPEPDLLTLLQVPCADPFLFPSTSDEALEIRRMLNR